MSDLIDRQALCDDLREYKVYPVPISSDESEVKGYNDGIDLAISVIAEFPSAEPEERTAKVVKEDNIRICDNCSGLILIPFDNTEENLRKYAITGYKGHNIYFASYKYCPNCGAKLDWSEQ